MKRIFFFVYLLAAAGVLVGEWLDAGIVYQLCKPVLMLALLAHYFSVEPAGERSGPLVLALVLSWFGDIALMFSGEMYFMLGLAAFLMSHLFYVVTYRQHINPEGSGLNGIQKVRFAFPIVLAGTGLMTVLYPSLNGMTIPVSIYAVVLTVMVLQALFRFGFTGSNSFWMVFSGAVLFMISDSLLAINKFLSPFPSAGWMVMLTYMAAQGMIVSGLIRHR